MFGSQKEELAVSSSGPAGASRGTRDPHPVPGELVVAAVTPATLESGSERSPFPRLDSARSSAAVAATSTAVPAPGVADQFATALDRVRPRPRERGARLGEHADPLLDLRRRERIFRRLLVLADAVTAAAAVLIALDVVGGGTPRPLLALVVPLLVLGAKVGGLYDKDELVIDHTTLNELPRLVNLATMFALFVWLARRYLDAGAQPRTLALLTLWLLLTAGLVVTRAVARRVAQRVAPVERCLLVGHAHVFEQLSRWFDGYRSVSLVRHVDAAELAREDGDLRGVIERDRIHRIIIDTDAISAAATLDAVHLANAVGLQVSLVPTILGAVGGSVMLDDIGGLVLMGVPRFGLSRSSTLLKRLFDLAGSAVALVVLAPLLVLIALAIKLDSRGPLLFRQTRMGRNDVPFEMFKFRSMIDGADALKESLREHNEADGGLFKIENDPRITRVGRLLRRTGLDELPQLFNVLSGSMSLVGPRPLVIDEDLRVTGFDRRRLHLTPGITGRWQTLGGSRVPLSEMVKIDHLYIANWSPWTDLRIIIDTMVYLARRSNQ